MKTITHAFDIAAALLLAFVLLAVSPSLEAQLAPAVQVDQLRRLAERDISGRNFSAALAKLDQALALRDEHSLEISPEVWFRHGEASFQSQLYAQAVTSLISYLTKADQEADNFFRGVNLLVEAHEKVPQAESDSQTLMAQFSPVIQIDLLQVYVRLHKERGQNSDAAAKLDQLLEVMEDTNMRFTSRFWRQQAAWARGVGFFANAVKYANRYLRGQERDLPNWASELRSIAAMSEAVRRTAEQFESMDVDTGREFRDCAGCPVMVVIPPGSFLMGCVSGLDCQRDERPVRQVTISRPFAVSKYEITRDEWSRFSGETLQGQWPAVDMSWNDAKDYVSWLSLETGQHYRLLSEAEWEYAARAGSVTKYSWGNEIGRNRANCDSCGSQWDEVKTAPVGSFPANSFGLHDMHGNAYEWVEDCSNRSYTGSPTDGSAWLSGNCARRIFRGGYGWNSPSGLRSARRYYTFSPSSRLDYLGLRVARTLTH